jgi:hypothetical protein
MQTPLSLPPLFCSMHVVGLSGSELKIACTHQFGLHFIRGRFEAAVDVLSHDACHLQAHRHCKNKIIVCTSSVCAVDTNLEAAA